MRNSTLLLLALLLLGAMALAAKQFAPPKAFHANTYPARDEHANEKASVAVDPYDMPDKAEAFSVNYKEHGLLPVRLIISNDGEVPLTLTSMKIQLITVNRDKIPPATEDDIYRRLSKLKRRGDEPSRNPLPIPLPRGKSSAGVSKDAAEEIEAAQFRARAVEPHTTHAGFLFFDVSGISNPLAGAHLYVTGVRDGNGQELMYFEIPLEKYLTYRPPK
jgi:hypothetical protein